MSSPATPTPPQGGHGEPDEGDGDPSWTPEWQPDDPPFDDRISYGPGGDMLLPSEREALAAGSRPGRRVARAATRAATRAVANRVGDIFGAGGPAFRVLANAHAASTAGDTLVAIALANTLFFSVPSSEARGNVALYLLLTVAPFAVIGPVLGWVMDRPGAERATLIGASLIRLIASAALIMLADTVWLFPLAFALMVLSRVHGISRSALLPQALDNAIALVTANARLAQVGVIAGAIAAPIGAGAAALTGGASAKVVLGLAGVMFAIAVWQSFEVPKVDLRPDETVDPTWVGAHVRPLPLEHSGQPMVATTTATRTPLSAQLKLARLATAAVRLLNGFLVLLLAFAFRDVDAPLADFGAVLAAAGGGFAIASIAAPWLERNLREEPMVVAALIVESAAAFILKDYFGLPAAMFLALAAGYAWGTAKFAYDGLLQANVAAEGRGRAFTHSETIFQLAWVLGAIAPTAITIDVNIGLSVAGATAMFAQLIYVSRLLQRA